MSKQEVEKKPVSLSESEKKTLLQKTLYHFMNAHDFYGNMLTEFTIKFQNDVPGFCLQFNLVTKVFEILLQPEMFAALTHEERMAILHHEILHFANKHCFRFQLLNTEMTPELNISADCSINQYIKGLPKGSVDVREWKQDDGSPFPLLKSMEEYYHLIKQEQQTQEKNKNTKGNVKEQMGKYVPTDYHQLIELTEEIKQQMIDEAKTIVRRTKEKVSGHTKVPDEVNDLLQELEAMDHKLNHKQILKNAIKKNLSATDRMPTYHRPNKKYGVYAPGTKNDNLPSCAFFFDTSGSMGYQEINDALKIMETFLQFGSKNCTVGFWHTSLYKKRKHRRGSEIGKNEIQSGGTDVQQVIDDIRKSNYNLTFIFTDLYFDAPEGIPSDKEVLWLVSKGGNKEHKFPKHHKVIFLENLT